MKKINIDLLGSTGSIGEQAIDVARTKGVQISSICANKNFIRVEEQAREFKPAFCAMSDYDAAKELKIRLADTGTKVLCGEDGILEMISKSKASVTLNAIVGEAGLLPSIETIKSNKSLALANKESLVVGGDIVMSLAKKKNVRIIPVDSEHCAIYQCLKSGNRQEVKRLIITASGGPFFNYSKEQLQNVNAKHALAHPTWSMGAKITIDSATLINKGFELIEASYLFNIDIEKIKPIIHRESIIHSMVEYIDNSVIAQMSVSDMRYCIQYGILGGKRSEAVIGELNLCEISRLSFYEPNHKLFPLLNCAVECKKKGGALPAVLNAANEIAVAAFLAGKLSYFGICDTIFETLDKLQCSVNYNELSDILEADKEARAIAKSIIER